MFTLRIERVGDGALAPKRSEMPSSGWIRSTSEFASRCSEASRENGRCGGRLNCTATSVTRLASRLPVRM